MSQEEKNTGAAPAGTPGTTSAQVPTAEAAKKVTSEKTIDFPSLDWGIHAGEVRALPVDEAAQKVILSNVFISEVK